MISIPTSIKTHFVFVASALAISGCATTGSLTENSGAKADPKQAERSRVYFEGITALPATETSGSCSVPADFDKIQIPKAGAWRDVLPRANACVRKRDWKTLETLATGLARMDLDSPWGAYYLGVVADEMGDRARAEWMMDLANKKSDGKVGLFVYQRARIYSHATFANHMAKAVTEMQKAVALSPELLEGHLFLGEIFQRDLQFDDSARAFQAVLDRDALSYRALTGLAEVEVVRGHQQVAYELYKRARSVDRSSRPGFDLESRIKVVEAVVLKDAPPAGAATAAVRESASVRSQK